MKEIFLKSEILNYCESSLKIELAYNNLLNEDLINEGFSNFLQNIKKFFIKMIAIIKDFIQKIKTKIMSFFLKADKYEKYLLEKLKKNEKKILYNNSMEVQVKYYDCKDLNTELGDDSNFFDTVDLDFLFRGFKDLIEKLKEKNSIIPPDYEFLLKNLKERKEIFLNRINYTIIDALDYYEEKEKKSVSFSVYYYNEINSKYADLNNCKKILNAQEVLYNNLKNFLNEINKIDEKDLNDKAIFKESISILKKIIETVQNVNSRTINFFANYKKERIEAMKFILNNINKNEYESNKDFI